MFRHQLSVISAWVKPVTNLNRRTRIVMALDMAGGRPTIYIDSSTLVIHKSQRIVPFHHYPSFVR